jgi:hypothetical protein
MQQNVMQQKLLDRGVASPKKELTWVQHHNQQIEYTGDGICLAGYIMVTVYGYIAGYMVIYLGMIFPSRQHLLGNDHLDSVLSVCTLVTLQTGSTQKRITWPFYGMRLL